MSLTVLRDRKKYLRYPLPLINLKEEQALFRGFREDALGDFLGKLKGGLTSAAQAKGHCESLDAEGAALRGQAGAGAHDRKLSAGGAEQNPFNFQDVITCADAFVARDFFAKGKAHKKEPFLNLLLGTDKKFALFMKSQAQGIGYFTSLGQIPVRIRFVLKNSSGGVTRAGRELAAVPGPQKALPREQLPGRGPALGRAAGSRLFLCAPEQTGALLRFAARLQRAQRRPRVQARPGPARAVRERSL